MLVATNKAILVTIKLHKMDMVMHKITERLSKIQDVVEEVYLLILEWQGDHDYLSENRWQALGHLPRRGV